MLSLASTNTRCLQNLQKGLFMASNAFSFTQRVALKLKVPKFSSFKCFLVSAFLSDETFAFNCECKMFYVYYKQTLYYSKKVIVVIVLFLQYPQLITGIVQWVQLNEIMLSIE